MRRVRLDIPYVSLLAGAFALAVLGSWTAAQIDNDAYDWMFRMYRPRPWQTQSALLAIDEESLRAVQGMRHLRGPLAEALARVAAARPRAVAIDVILADEDPASDGALESAFRATPKLVLPCEFPIGGTAWELPLPRFARWAEA